MTNKEFIEKAIEGGWEDPHKYAEWEIAREKGLTAFLQPQAWEAVGKVGGWYIDESKNFHANYEWALKMHQMIDHLIEGGTINSYLETL